MRGSREARARRSAAAALRVVFVGILSWGAVGCIVPAESMEGVVSGDEQADFYAPPQFDFVRGSSYERFPTLRSWNAEYIGRARIPEVTPLYVSEMPKLGWTLQTILSTSEDQQTLVFFKGDEEATVELTRSFSGKFGAVATTIQGAIRPRELQTYEEPRTIQGQGTDPSPAPGRPATRAAPANMANGAAGAGIRPAVANEVGVGAAADGDVAAIEAHDH